VRFTAGDVARATSGALVGEDVEIDGASIDSRTRIPSQLFVPIVGERDGHDFVEAARDAGAVAYLTSRAPVGGDAIEVADTSVDYDRNVKLPLYAQAGIPEAWLVRLRESCIEIHRNPAATGYQEMRTLRSGDRLSPLAFQDFELTVAAILG